MPDNINKKTINHWVVDSISESVEMTLLAKNDAFFHALAENDALLAIASFLAISVIFSVAREALQHERRFR